MKAVQTFLLLALGFVVLFPKVHGEVPLEQINGACVRQCVFAYVTYTV